MASESYLSLPIFEKPMCLISTAEDGRLQAEKDALEQIKQIDAPLVVVAIAGLYRTGKSYLMNRLAGETSGFALGKTIESKTKGIWVWCKKHPKTEGNVLLLLDTEGLGDVAKGDSGHDNKIFTIAALLSNVLVYNMMTAFNQDAVEKLTFITEMSKNIRFCNSEENVGDKKLGLILPQFILCVRDFNLELELDGKPITTDEYLEDCLQLRKEKGMERYNRPRECIRKYFANRKCFVFEAPGNKKVIQSLETMSNEKLTEEFVEETNKFLKHVYACEAKVLISSKSVNGHMFVPLVESYINAIRDGAIPDVDDAIMVVANIENERMANEAVKHFKDHLKDVTLPILNTSKFEGLYQDMQIAALAKFRLESVFNAEKYEKSAIDEMNRLWEKTKEDNLQLVRKHCEEVLSGIYESHVGTKINNNEYEVAGAYSQYKLDIEHVKKEYRKAVKEIDEYEANQVIVLFMDSEGENERRIMMADQKMTEEERRLEIERANIEHKQAQESQAKLFESRLDEERKRAEEHQEKMTQERNEYISNQEKKMQDIKNMYDEQRNLNEKQIALMREDNEVQRKEFQKEIRELTENFAKKELENKAWMNEWREKEIEKAERRMADANANLQKILEDEKSKSAMLMNMMQTYEKQLETMKEEKEKAEKRFADDKVDQKKLREEAEKQMKQYSEMIKSLQTQINNAPRSEDVTKLKQSLETAKEEKQQLEKKSCNVM